jgi:hypothetical protein
MWDPVATAPGSVTLRDPGFLLILNRTSTSFNDHAV